MNLFDTVKAAVTPVSYTHLLLQQLQPRVHHAQPLVMAGQILALFADDLAQPLFDLRRCV